MLRKAYCQLKESKTFVASTRITASMSGDSYSGCMACIVTSQPDICTAHTRRGHAADCMSSFMVLTTALQMICQTVSPIPIG